MTYQYIIFGLKTSCKFKLGPYPRSSFKSTPDLLIRKGKIKEPPLGLEKTVYKPFSVANRDFYYLDVAGISKYLVKGKDTIIIEKYPNASWQDVWAFLFDSVFTIALIKNDKFVFHASALAFGKKTVMFCGPSGIGKSTLAVALANTKNAKIVEDDKCLIHLNKRTGKFQIKNHYPFLELWSPQMGIVQKESKLKLQGKIREGIDKYRLDLTDHSPKRATDLHRIVLISTQNLEDGIVYEEIKGFKKVNIVKNFSHMHYLIPILGKSKEHFGFMSSLVNGMTVHRITKSKLTPLDSFIKFIEHEVIG